MHKFTSALVCLLLAFSATGVDAKSCKSKKITAVVGGAAGAPNLSNAHMLWQTKVTAKYGPAYSKYGIAKSRKAKCKTSTGAGGAFVQKCTVKGKPCRP